MTLSTFDIFDRVIVSVNGVLAYCMNFILIILILFRSPKHMGTYRYLMLCFVIFSIIYVTTHLVVMPNMHVFEYGFCLMPSSLLNGTRMPAHWGLVFWGMLFTQSLVLISFHFVYRYCLVCRNELLVLFNSWKYVPIWVTIWAFMGACCAATLHFLMFHTEEYQNHFRETLWENYQFDVNTTAILGPLYKKTNALGEEEWDEGALLSYGICALLHGSTFLMIAYCTYNINKTLKTVAMSEKLKRVQYEFFKALLVQTIIPSIFEYIPFLVIFSSPLLRIPIGRGANFVPIFVSFYPMLDPICIIYFIKDYRYSMLGKLKKKSIGVRYEARLDPLSGGSKHRTGSSYNSSSQSKPEA